MSQTALSDLDSELRDGAVLESRGVFTVAIDKAREKLRQTIERHLPPTFLVREPSAAEWTAITATSPYRTAQSVRTRHRPAAPDGMECDALGNVWVTGPGGVWAVSPEGELLGVLEAPEVCKSLVWGGADLRSLFLMTETTVHVVRTRVAGVPLPPDR